MKSIARNINEMRPGFTLVELLVVIVLMGVLAAMMTYAMAGARQEAREKRAQAEIQAMSSILLQKLNEIYLQPMAFTPRVNTSALGALVAGDEVRNGEEHNRVIMLARRDLARMALPQCRADLMYPPARLQYRRRVTAGAVAGAVKVKEPGEWGDMRRLARFTFPKGADIERLFVAANKVFASSAPDPLYGANGYFSSTNLRNNTGSIVNDANAPQIIDLMSQNADWMAGNLSAEDPTFIPWTREYESAECLYLILATTQLLGERAIDQFSARMIANLDNDAVPEVVDPWGVPYEFIREATGLEAPFNAGVYATALAHPAGSDGNDFLRTDFRYSRLPGSQLDDPFRTVPLIVSAGTDGEFGIRRSFDKTGDIALGTAGISPAASISVVRLIDGAGNNLPRPMAAAGAYQYPDPFMSFLPADDVTNAVSLGNMTAFTLRSWNANAYGLAAVIDPESAADNIYSTKSLGLNR